MPKRFDPRPICTCTAYGFPHRVGGRCTGSVFAEYHFYNVQTLCDGCNCRGDTYCEVVTGQESYKEAECYMDVLHYNPGEYLQIEMIEPENPYDH